jgi:hypothetical protein
LSWEPFKYIPHQQKGKKTLEGQTKPFSLQKVSLTLMKPEISSQANIKIQIGFCSNKKRLDATSAQKKAKFYRQFNV